MVAEVVSRFEKVGSFVRKMLKLGFELSKKVSAHVMCLHGHITHINIRKVQLVRGMEVCFACCYLV